ncbi:hypothetical protein [uncultured Microscilla sp.]|uniref:hypothetical protein n=1 Tax=uncultured Microscilla sp. TaxID=432653 RepID=UPI00262417A0|nr:hypothetical protein [uncultured Microscilla sp.]
MKTILTSLLTLAMLSQGQSQDNKMRKFEQKLATFRYSLYQDLAQLKSKTLYSWFGKDPQEMPKELNQKLQKFYNDHAKTIRNYRLYQLRLHATNTPIKISEYKEVEVKNKDINLNPSKISAWNHIFTVNPLRHLEIMSTKILAHQLSATEFGSQSLYDNLAHPRMIARKLANQHWEVWIDKYFWVLKFDYQPETVTLELKELFKRKD